jgi:hypothetical protein
MLAVLFQRQQELMDAFREIEQLPAAPLPIHTGHGQRILKDFAWRTTEELTEAFHALMRTTDDIEAKMHAGDELADALHFLIELFIFAGITPGSVLTRMSIFPASRYNGHVDSERLSHLFWRVAFELGIAMNFLKNRPWKRKPQPTDEGRFRLALLEVFISLMTLWAELGYSETDMYKFYMNKRSENVDRIQRGV